MLPIVPVTPRNLADYAEDAGADRVERLREAARPLAGARVLQINTTAYGGGVAELLHTHVPLLNDLGLEVEWALFQGSDEFFSITKAMHNALQGAEIAWTLEMQDRKSTRLNSSHVALSRMPSSA